MSKFDKWGLFIITVPLIAFALGIFGIHNYVTSHTETICQGAQKRVEDTFKVMDACQKLIGCTITVDDLREAQEQINQAESCK